MQPTTGGPRPIHGSIMGAILRMGIPSMIGFASGNLYDLVDAFWLSRMGTIPVAAVTILGPYLWVISSANMAVGAGSVAIISRRFGEGDLLRTELAIRETLLLKWLAALVFGLIGFVTLPWVVRLLGAEGEVIGLSTTYGRIIFAGLGFNFATYSIFTALRGVANPRMAMAIMLGFTGLNIILDPFLIFGWWIFPALGVAGAAWASVISYAAAFLAGVLILGSGAANVKVRLRTHAGESGIQWGLMWRILRIGIPSALGSLSFSLARTVIMPIIATFGMGVVAAYGVGTRITSLGITLLVGIGLGLSALIGQTLGAGDRERARRTAYQALLLATGIMTALAIAVFFGAEWILLRFFQEPEIVSVGSYLLRVLTFGFPFIAVFMTLENVYTGVGENRPMMVLNLFHAWLLEVPIVYLAVKVMGLGSGAVWWTISGAHVLSAIAFFLYFRRGKWLDVVV